MLTANDKAWLRKKHPGLKHNHGEVSGRISFTAAYNPQIGQFFILESNDVVDGDRLSGVFDVTIRERTDNTWSRLPALFVKGVEPAADRHFNQLDYSACLCSPLDEDEFLPPNFQFSLFLERLVVPFLYGQLFYSENGRWPWPDYPHGAAGLFESYLKNKDSSKARELLQKLTHDKKWSAIKRALQQRPYVKGHTLCFCEKENLIRQCHPDALEGIRQLRLDIQKQRIPLPD